MEGAIRHAEHPTVPEFTACGVAGDAHESGDVEAPVLFAAPRARVTCQDCRRTVLAMRQVRLDGRGTRASATRAALDSARLEWLIHQISGSESRRLVGDLAHSGDLQEWRRRIDRRMAQGPLS